MKCRFDAGLCPYMTVGSGGTTLMREALSVIWPNCDPFYLTKKKNKKRDYLDSEKKHEHLSFIRRQNRSIKTCSMVSSTI